MSLAAAALQFSTLDLADAEWSEEQEELAAAAAVDNKARRLEALKTGLRIGQTDGSPTSLSELKAEVAMVVAGGRGAGPAWPTGVHELDAALGGGVPRGRVTEVVGPLGAGKTSLVRQLVARVLAEGGWVAWVDATRTLAPQDLAGLGERLIVVRPHDHTRGAWCADLLLRSGVFALVVLDGAPVLSRTVGVRLSQLARERDAAFVVLREGTQSSRLGGAVRLQLRPIRQSQPATSLLHGVPSSHQTFVSNSANTTLSNTASPTGVPISMTVPVAIPMTTAIKLPMKITMPMSAHRKENGRQENTRLMRAENTSGNVQAIEHGPMDRRFSVLVEKGGLYRTVEVTCAIVVARRVCTDTEIPDRRGLARGARAAGGTEQEHVQHEQSGTAKSIRAESAAGERVVFQSDSDTRVGSSDIASNHRRAVDVGIAGPHTGDTSWKKGRGRPRMAESSYGRTTRRGKARKFLARREHAEAHNGNYERKQRAAEFDSSTDKHTHKPNRQQERRESRQQSRRALSQPAGTLG